MKRFLIIIGAIFLLIVAAAAAFIFIIAPQKEATYQADATRKRLSDVYEVASLLEECKSKQGVYPFVHDLQQPPEDSYTSVPLAVMLSQPDQNWVNQPFPFTMSVSKYPAAALIEELSSCLHRQIDLPIDPQRRPYLSPNTYIILFTKDNSYVVLAFLYDKHKYSSQLAEHVYAFAVSSELGPDATSMLSGMHITPKKFIDIPVAEVSSVREDGKKADQMFSKWATTRVSR
jgi:hypothetical protein